MPTSNPFYYNQPTSPNDFVGRWELIGELAADLSDRIRADSWAVIGGRRFGKSSVLKVVHSHLLGKWVAREQGARLVLPVIADVKRCETHSEGNFYLCILRELYRALSAPSSISLDLSVTQLSSIISIDIEECSFHHFEDILDDLTRRLEGEHGAIRIALLLDELEAVTKFPWAETLFDKLRALVYDGSLADRIKLVLTGSTRVIQARASGSPLLNAVNIVHLKSIAPEEAERLIARAGQTPDEVCAVVKSKSGGHPFIAQYLLHYLWKDNLTQATPETVENVARRMRQERAGDLRGWWKAITSTGQRLYSLLLEVGDWQDERALLGRINEPLLPVDQGLAALCYHGLAIRDDSGQNYRVAGELFQEWYLQNIKQHSPSSPARQLTRRATNQSPATSQGAAMTGLPKSLVTAVESGLVVPFTGIGVSMALRGHDGNPLVVNWRQLLYAAADWLDEDLQSSEADLLRQQLDADPTFGSPFRRAQQALGPRFIKFLREKLDPPREVIASESLDLARAVWRLSDNFVVTIDHGRSLMWGCPGQPAVELIDAASVPTTVQQLKYGLARPRLWHVFGTLENGDPIFTFEGERSLLREVTHDARLSTAAGSLRELFAGPHTVVFIGTSAPGNFSTSLFANAKEIHYWLVHETEFEQCRRDLRARDLRMIQPVAVKNYPELPSLLDNLAKHKGRTRVMSSDKFNTAPTADPPTFQQYTERMKTEGDEDSVGQQFDVAIVCALHSPELEKVMGTGGQAWEPLPSERSDPHTYHRTVYTTLKNTPLRVVAAAPNQMGLVASAVLATKMILRFRPKLVAMVGIAAGVKTDTQGYGDILAAEHTFDYGAGKIVAEDGNLILKPDPKPHSINARLKARLKEWESRRTELDAIYKSWPAQKPRTILSLHLGPLASGAAVVNDQAPVKDVMAHWRKLIGLEMEAYAVHCACEEAVEPSPVYLCLKSICDFAQNKDDNWQQYAAFTAAELCYRFLTTEWEQLHLS